MVKLSDYLNYLHKEVIQARKQIDENSVALAKEYAKDEYLKFFRVPRFTMPSVKLDIPIKINDINATTEYSLEFKEEEVIKEVNDNIKLINKKNDLNIKPINSGDLKSDVGKSIIKGVKLRDYNAIKLSPRKINKPISIIKNPDITKPILPKPKPNPRIRTNEELEIQADVNEDIRNSIITDVLKSKAKPISANLNNIFIDPDTSKAEDKDKLFLNMQVEMVEEGLRIRSIKDKNGNEIEEIIFE